MKIGFIGGGKMAEALVRGIISARTVRADDVAVSDISDERCALLQSAYGVRVGHDNPAVVADSDVVVLAVKPQGLDAVLAEIAATVTAHHLVISIAAGKRLAGIATVLRGARLARVMPNLPATVGQGMSVYCMGAGTTEADAHTVQTLLAVCGKVCALPEEQFDAVTAVSGSGPAFFAHFLALVIEAAQTLGLKGEDASLLATQTMLGTAYLLDDQAVSPAALVEAVCSKKGTTEAGMAELSSPALAPIVQATLKAAADRSRELSA